MAVDAEGTDPAIASSTEENGELSMEQFCMQTAWADEDDLTTRVPNQGNGQRERVGSTLAAERGRNALRGRNTGAPKFQGAYANHRRSDSFRSASSRHSHENERGSFRRDDRREGPRNDSQSIGGIGGRKYGDSFQRQRRGFQGKGPISRRPWVPLPPPDVDYSVTFYATDEAFRPIAEHIHETGKTFETFQIAQSFLSAPEKFVFVLRKNPDAREKFYHSPLDGIPFSTVDGAIEHLLRNHRDSIVEVEIVEDLPLQGNFSMVTLCPFTKKPIGSPSYHNYKKLLQEHFLEHIYGISFERFCDRLESSSTVDDINAWLESMRQKRIYRLKAKNEEELDTQKSLSEEQPVTILHPEEVNCGEKSQGDDIGKTPETCVRASNVPTFSTFAEIRDYIRNNASEYICTTECVRVPGTAMEKIRDKIMRRFIEYHWHRQKKFPLETANSMRGKFKQNNLHSYKRGKRGISYVCSSPRKFRDGDVRLGDALDTILDVIDATPHISSKELVVKIANDLQREDIEKHLAWLIHEGYVAEFEDGKLLAHPKSGQERQMGKNDGEEMEPCLEENSSATCGDCCDCASAEKTEDRVTEAPS